MTLIERPDGWKILNGHSSSSIRRAESGVRGTSSP
jgi:hypothetical protein